MLLKAASPTGLFDLEHRGKYGQYVSASRAHPALRRDPKARMESTSDDYPSSGKFVRDFMLEELFGQPTLKSSTRANDEHQSKSRAASCAK